MDVCVKRFVPLAAIFPRSAAVFLIGQELCPGKQIFLEWSPDDPFREGLGKGRAKICWEI